MLSILAVILAAVGLNGLANAQCTPTGPGVCNLGITVGNPGGSEDTTVTLYDNYCNNMASAYNPGAGYCMDSSLPYTVCIREIDNTVNPHIIFDYAAVHIDSNNGGCSCGFCGSGPLPNADCCQCAFDC